MSRCKFGLVMIALGALAGSGRAQEKPSEGLSIDKDAKKVIIPAVIAPRKLPNLTEVYPIEIIAGYPAPRGQKAHETVVTIDVKPSDVHKAMEELGLKAGKPAKGEDAAAEGPEVAISLEIPASGTLKRVIPIERALVDRKTGKQMPKLKWKFTGSAMKQTDPDKPELTYGADTTGTLIAIFPVTDETVFQTHLTMKDEPLIKLETNTAVLPKEGTPVKLIIQAAP